MESLRDGRGVTVVPFELGKSRLVDSDLVIPMPPVLRWTSSSQIVMSQGGADSICVDCLGSNQYRVWKLSEAGATKMSESEADLAGRGVDELVAWLARGGRFPADPTDR